MFENFMGKRKYLLKGTDNYNIIDLLGKDRDIHLLKYAVSICY